MNIGTLVQNTARRHGKRLACFDERRSFTYADVDQRSNRLAHALRERFRLDAGARVALITKNRAEVSEVIFGVAKAGLVYVGMNFRLTENELRSILENADPGLIVIDPEFVETVRPVADDLGIGMLELGVEYETVLGAGSDVAPSWTTQVRSTDSFCINYTSGTTGVPKGILFDHGSICQHASVAALEYEMTAGTRYLMSLPHNSSMNITIMPCTLVGGAIGYFDNRSFSGDDFMDRVNELAITHSYLVPTQVYRVLDSLSRSGKSAPTIQTLGYGAAPISPDRALELLERFGPVLTQLYGMAEIASIGTILSKAEHAAAIGGRLASLRSVGRPSYLVDIQVVDDDGRPVTPGQLGEVTFGTPYAMKGYYRNPEMTAAALRDGRVYSGDIGRFDVAGFLRIEDRKKDLIIKGGLNIVPSEIERVLLTNPGVLEAAVIGVPHAEWGEDVFAVLALRDGVQATPAELLEWCRRQPDLAGIKTPSSVALTPSLPKNAIGKIDKKALRVAHATSRG